MVILRLRGRVVLRKAAKGVFFFWFENLGDRVLVSGPEGAFSLRPLRDITHLYLLAAGTGFTPMTRLISLAIQEMENIR